ncbi:MAG: beta-ketoacyl-ACP synthase III [Candidatus Diapherotrites archaeon]
MKAAGISGTGSYLPERIVSNKELEKSLDTSDEWIWKHIGIRERRFAEKNQPTSHLSLKAAEKALKAAGTSAEELDLIIVATASPDMPTPSTACILQDKLKANKAGAFDLNNACTGFVYGLAAGAKFIADESCKKVLLVGAETPHAFMDPKDRGTYVFFGDGAGAVVLSETEKGRGVLGSYLRSDGSGAMDLGVPGGGTMMPPSIETIKNRQHFIKMNAQKIKEFVIKAFPDSVHGTLRNAGLKLEDVDMIIPHQANARLIEYGMKALGLPMEKAFINMHKYGNTIGASIPIALDEAVHEGKISKGDLVLLVGFGGGLSWGGVALRW